MCKEIVTWRLQLRTSQGWKPGKRTYKTEDEVAGAIAAWLRATPQHFTNIMVIRDVAYYDEKGAK